MQKCYNCGKEVDDNVLICPDCGALVKRYGKPVPVEPDSYHQQPQPDAYPGAYEAPAQPGPRERVWLDAAGKPHFKGALCLWLIVCAVFAVKRRDNASLFIVIGYLAQLLPWVFITRTTFEYHYFPSSVFLVLAIARVFKLMKDNTKGWKFNVYGLTGLACALFIAFYPVISGVRVNAQLATNLLKWLPSWPF